MATVIDALIVTLGLDGKAFFTGSDKATKAMKDTAGETDRMAKNMEARGKQAAAAFGAIRNQALALLAVFTAGVGLKNFAVNTVAGAASLGRMSENLSISTEKLTAFQRANEMVGGSAAGMAAQLKESSNAVANAKMGMSGGDAAGWFYRMGGQDLRGYKDGNEYLLARSKIISDIYKKDPSRALAVASSMGISEETFNLLKQGPDQVKKMVEEAQRLSPITKRDSDNAERLRQKFLQLGWTFDSTGTKVLLALMPAFDKIILRLQSMADWIDSHKEDIAKWVGDAIVWFEDFAKTLDKGAESVGGWKNVLIALAGLKVLAMVSPLIQLASALGLVGSSLGLIGTVGAAGIAVLIALKAAEALGLPETDIEKGVDDLRKGNWLAASTHLPAGDFLQAVKDNMTTGDPLASMGKTKESEKLFDGLESKYDLPKGLLDSVWAQESSRGKHMLSPAGAKGHFQFMDPTAKQYELKDPNNLNESADAAARMYRDLLKQYKGDMPKALAAYNWGSGNLAKKGLENAPEETRKYIAQVMRRMSTERKLASSVPSERDKASGVTAEKAKNPLPLNADNRPDRGVVTYFTKRDGDISNISSMNNAPVSNVINTVSMANRATDPSRGRVTPASNTSTSEVHIGKIDVVTQATDAAGISRDLEKSLGKLTAPQANTGLR